MSYNPTTVLELVKARKERAGVETPAPLVTYWTQRIEAAGAELTRKGIILEDTADDNALVADLAVERINNRDNAKSDPEWLRLQIRHRFFQQSRETV
jgi:hypothetical protein